MKFDKKKVLAVLVLVAGVLGGLIKFVENLPEFSTAETDVAADAGVK